MTDVAITGWILIVANFIVSYQGFTNNSFFEGYLFDVDKILIHKDYKRLITSGFLHVNWLHLILNMLALNSFADAIEQTEGSVHLLLLYFGSLLGGNLLSLFIHRNHGDYTAAGASGAISGLIFASIALYPGIEVSTLGLPSIPGWIFGLLFCVISIFGIKSRFGNIGHDAHLGGALTGALLAILINPSILQYNLITIVLITIPALAFLIFIVIKPEFLFLDNVFSKPNYQYQSIDEKYNENKIKKQKELDKLLDKINKKGFKSLSKSEIQRLEELSE